MGNGKARRDSGVRNILFVSFQFKNDVNKTRVFIHVVLANKNDVNYSRSLLKGRELKSFFV
jgi:hypothetical protein